MRKTTNISRLSVDLSKEIHKEIKVRAVDRNISMRVWVLRAILRQLEYERKGDK